MSRWRFPILCIFLTFVSFPRLASAVQEELKVGDQVEIQFMGKTVEGEIVSFFGGANWPKVKFNANGRSNEIPFPPNKVKKIGSGKPAGSKNKPATDVENPFADPPSNVVREWVDSTGRFKIMAKLLSESNGKVELEKEDGRVISLPVNKLGEADQKYLADLKLANSEENPFAGGVMKDSSAPDTAGGTGTSASNSGSAIAEPTIEPNFSSNEIVLTGSEWKVTSDAAVAAEFSNKVIRPSQSLAGNPFHSRVSNFLVSTNHQFAAATATNAFDDFSELITIDLGKGKARNNLKIPMKDCGILAISPTGNVAATIRKGRGADPGRIDFWKIGDNSISQSNSWKTAGFHDRNGFAPETGVLLDDTRLLTFGRQAALWDCETATALYSFPSTGPTALSANQKQLAVSNQSTIYIVNVDDAEVLGAIETDGQGTGGLAFSESGKFLAAYSSQSGAIRVWDLSNGGELVQQMATPGGTGSSIQWVGDKYLFMNQKYLMDVELRSTVWEYEVAGGSIFTTGDTRFWFVSKEKLTPITLPHKNLDPLTAKFDPDQLLVLKPGASVAVDINLPFPPDEQKSIRDHLVSELEKNGVKVDSSADLTLRATVKKGKPETREMSSWTDPFGRRGTTTINFTPSTSQVELLKDGQPIWTKATLHTVGMLSLSKDETVQQAASRACQPNPKFFSSIVLPPYLARLPDDQVGNSKITEAGIN